MRRKSKSKAKRSNFFYSLVINLVLICGMTTMGARQKQRQLFLQCNRVCRSPVYRVPIERNSESVKDLLSVCVQSNTFTVVQIFTVLYHCTHTTVKLNDITVCALYVNQICIYSNALYSIGLSFCGADVKRLYVFLHIVNVSIRCNGWTPWIHFLWMKLDSASQRYGHYWGHCRSPRPAWWQCDIMCCHKQPLGSISSTPGVLYHHVILGPYNTQHLL